MCVCACICPYISYIYGRDCTKLWRARGHQMGDGIVQQCSGAGNIEKRWFVNYSKDIRRAWWIICNFKNKQKKITRTLKKYLEEYLRDMGLLVHGRWRPLCILHGKACLRNTLHDCTIEKHGDSALLSISVKYHLIQLPIKHYHKLTKLCCTHSWAKNCNSSKPRSPLLLN